MFDTKEMYILNFFFFLIVFFCVVAPLVEANTETDEGNYLLWRLEKGVAEGSIEIPKGTFLNSGF